ncbi:tRNA lysidine(34) synthetase TilS [Acidothermaceae bacterium B102]|nr:tRNA lysidine(34) synthetase TilS [Acidothermaceae bacterium B102]
MTGPAPAVAATRLAVRRCLPGLTGPVIVAVSGGADSLALLAAAAFEAPKQGVRVLAVTVDHGLQDGSAAQAAAVLAQAAALDVDAECVAVSVARDGGPEAAARTARYAALHEVAARVRADAVLLGHTLDDQAETVLLGLARGSGARSLAAMREVNGLLRRPLLGLRRATTEAACAALGLQPWSDPMNDDRDYARVRVRRDALPALEVALGPGVAEALSRTAEQLAQDADALDSWATTALAEVTDETGGLDVGGLHALPAAVRARVLRLAALRAGSPGGSLGSAHVRELDRLVTDWHGQGALALPGPVSAVRDCGRLLLTRHR